MNKVKILLALLCVALLCVACTTEPDPTVDPTGASEQLRATEEATIPVENIPGVEENVFEEDEIEIPSDPVSVDTGDGNVTNTGNGNQGSSNNQGSTGNQGGSNNQGSTGNQGGSNNQGSTGSQGGSNNQGSTGDQGGSNNQGGSGNQGSSEQPTEPGTNGSDTDSFYVSYEEYNAMSPEEQVEYFNKFPSMEAFVEWYNEAKAEYDEENGAIEIGGDGSVDLGDIVNP